MKLYLQNQPNFWFHKSKHIQLFVMFQQQKPFVLDIKAGFRGNNIFSTLAKTFQMLIGFLVGYF